MQQNVGLNHMTMASLQIMLQECNPFIPLYQHAYERLLQAEQAQLINNDLTLCLHIDDTVDGRHYNMPTSEEIAAIIPAPARGEQNPDNHDIILFL